MEIRITGRINPDNLADNIQEVFEKYLQKLSEDSPEQYALLMDKTEESVITEVTVKSGFLLEGQEELQVLTVDPHGTGHPEMLVVTAETNGAGELVWDTVKDNENDSKFTELEVLIAEGLPTDYKEVDSQYYSDQLEEIEVITVGTYQIVIYELLTAENKAVIQYVTENRIAAEIEIDLKDTQTMQDVLQHYKQLL